MTILSVVLLCGLIGGVSGGAGYFIGVKVTERRAEVAVDAIGKLFKTIGGQ